MPQVDETRTYYTMKYKVLEDVSFKDFSRDFAFYAVEGFGDYEYLGYLDANNESQVVRTNSGGTQYVLGDLFPYFDMFKIADDRYGSSDDYANVSFIIYNATFNIADLTETPAFVITESDFRARLSLNVGELTLKAGDTIEINAIIMPWGSQQTDYTSAAPDKNVRDVRENSLIDPFKATAVENAEILESTFLPKIKTTNGKSATFTLSGGENNVTFRVYGFEKLTAPKLYELVDGEWVLVDVSSATTPDKQGNSHLYDGYAVHYDGDATFSYSFVTTLTGDQTRTFKVVASEDFTGWTEPVLPDDDKVENFWNAEDILAASGLGSLEEDGTFVRIYGDGVKGETYFMLPISSKTTGGYIVIKYRIPTSNDTTPDHFQCYIGTESSDIIGSKDWVVARDIKEDGEWHVMVIDVAKFNLENFVANAEGTYPTKYFRFDVFNAVMSANSYIDLQYVALCENMESVLKMNEDMTYVDLVERETTSSKIYISSGTGEASDADYFDLFIDASAIAQAGGNGNVSKVLSSDESYVTIGVEQSMPEAFMSIYSGGNKVTGQYIVIKYRIDAEDAQYVDEHFFIECFTSTVYTEATGSGDFFNTLGKELLVADGEWHHVVLEAKGDAFTANANGEYLAKYIRLDALNRTASEGGIPVGLEIDIAFVAMCSDTTEYFESIK